MDYGVYDAVQSGCTKLVFVIRREIEEQMTDHVDALVGRAVPVDFVFQPIGSLPNTATSIERKKPWGTAHAVLAAEQQVSGPFIVCNADDFYGASSYDALRDHLGGERQPGSVIEARQHSEGPVERHCSPHALVGYRLKDTLSPFGGVSRAVCECGSDGYLERLVEVKQIREVGSLLTGMTDAGESVRLDGSETVSMNVWGFTPGVFQLLKRQFQDFLLTVADDDAEFLISTAVNEQVAKGETRLRVMQARDEWFGMTFTNDRPLVMKRIRKLVDSGTYPRDLPAWFRQLP